jgi:hypothetical protein
MAKHGDPADVDVHARGDVDIGVPAQRQHGQRRPRPVHGRFAQIEIEITERAGDQRPAPQPEPSPPYDVPEQGRGEPGGGAARRRRRGRQILLNASQIRPEPRAEGGLDPFGELIQGEAPGHQMVPEDRDRLLALGIRDAVRRIVHPDKLNDTNPGG